MCRDRVHGSDSMADGLTDRLSPGGQSVLAVLGARDHILGCALNALSDNSAGFLVFLSQSSSAVHIDVNTCFVLDCTGMYVLTAMYL
jgi:hypothetical protein